MSREVYTNLSAILAIVSAHALSFAHITCRELYACMIEIDPRTHSHSALTVTRARRSCIVPSGSAAERGLSRQSFCCQPLAASGVAGAEGSMAIRSR